MGFLRTVFFWTVSLLLLARLSNGGDCSTSSCSVHCVHQGLVEMPSFTGECPSYSIYLEVNQIRVIKTNSLRGTVIVKPLKFGQFYLDHNNISTIEDGTFANVSINDLSLNYNQLRTITVSTFAGLKSVSSLRLDENQIESIEQDAFAALDRLAILSLNGNKLTTLADNTFAKLPRLNFLFLDSNGLYRFGKQSFQASTIYVELKWNELCAIEAEAINAPNSLLSVNLYNGGLRCISRDAFKVKAIGYMIMANNYLTRLDYCLMRTKRSMQHSSLTFLQKNPFVCDCSLAYLRNQTEQRRGMMYGNPTCRMPADQGGEELNIISFPLINCRDSDTNPKKLNASCGVADPFFQACKQERCYESGQPITTEGPTMISIEQFLPVVHTNYFFTMLSILEFLALIILLAYVGKGCCMKRKVGRQFKPQRLNNQLDNF